MDSTLWNELVDAVEHGEITTQQRERLIATYNLPLNVTPPTLARAYSVLAEMKQHNGGSELCAAARSAESARMRAALKREHRWYMRAYRFIQQKVS